MPYTFDNLFAVDPNNPAVVARNASILVYATGDATKTPVTLTDLTDAPVPNPITVNQHGFGPKLKHPTIDHLTWEGGGLSGSLISYEGLKDEAVAARQAAEAAGNDAAAAASASLAAAVADAEAAQTAAAASASSAADAAALVGAPADTAIAAAVNNPASATATALSATIATAFDEYEIREAPAGFSFRRLPIPVIRHLGYGKFAIDAPAYIAPYKPASGVTYYISPTGTSGNNGLTAGAPTTAASAAAKADVGTIIMAPGEYWRNTGFPIFAKSVNIIGSGAKPSDTILSGYENPSTLVWTLNAGNIYQTTRAATINVVDKRTAHVDAKGDWAEYEQVADLASIVKAGQWAIVGSTVYVWALGNANLATDASFIRLSINTGTGPLFVSGGNTIYAENFITEGGGTPTAGGIAAFSSGGTGGVPRLILVDVLAKYTIANGITATGADFVITVRSGAAITRNDGLNYHSGTFSGTTWVPDVLEVDPVGYNNGRWTTVETQNTSTSHDGISIIRIGGTLGSSFGPVMAEDGAGTKGWSLGVKFKKSTAITRNYSFAATAGAEAWLDECIPEEPSTFTIYADNASKVHTRNMVEGSSLGLRKQIKDTSTLDTY